MKKMLKKVFIVVTLTFSMTFLDWPQIPFVNFPPEIREAYAVTLNSESFEGAYTNLDAVGTSLSTWDDATGDDGNWTVSTVGTTPSSGTGPDTYGAQAGSNFIYIETSASQPCIGGSQECILEYQSTLDAGTYNITVAFYTHMLGAQIGTLYLEVNDGGGWVSRWSRGPGTQGDQWNSESVDLSTWYTSGNINVRFRAVANGSFLGDISLDNITVTGTTHRIIIID